MKVNGIGWPEAVPMQGSGRCCVQTLSQQKMGTLVHIQPPANKQEGSQSLSSSLTPNVYTAVL